MNARDLQVCISSLTPFPEEPPQYTWEHHRWALRKHVMADPIREFLRWSTVVATMFVGHAPYITHEYKALMSAPDKDRWERAIRDPGFGTPELLPYCGNSSGNFIHQAYHLLRWEQASGQKVQNLRKITEFGGGYGSLCLICRALGFSGEYLIYDVPEFSYLQSYYLTNLMVDFTPRMILPFKHQENQKAYRFLWECDNPNGGNDLLVGCYSLSEVRVDLREQFIDTINAEHVLIAHQDEYGGEDLIAYFDKFTHDRPHYEWQTLPINNIDGHYYEIGKKR